MDDFPERRGPMSKMCGLLTFGWQVELENEAMLKFLTVRGQFECVLDQSNSMRRCGEVDRSDCIKCWANEKVNGENSMLKC